MKRKRVWRIVSVALIVVWAVASKDSVLRVVPADTVSRRLSPTELRESRPVERSIHVVKEKPYRVIRKPGATRTGRRGH
jgi:hypothetical protein